MSVPRDPARARKDRRLIVGLTLAILVVWTAVSVLEQRAAAIERETIAGGLLIFLLSYINVTLIAAVLFVLGRTLIKLWLERRRAVLGSHFKTKLLVTYIGLTAIPIGLLFFTATQLLQRSIDRWFSTPVREVVDRARALETVAQRRILDEAREAAHLLSRFGERTGGLEDLAVLDRFRQEQRLESVEVYRDGARATVRADGTAPPPVLPPETLATATARGETAKVEVLPDGSHRYRAVWRAGPVLYAAGIRVPPDEARAMSAIASAWSDYRKLEVQKPSIKAASVSSFLLITLAVLFASTWTGLALARRLTEPIGALAESTRRLQAGDLSARVEIQAADELGVLVDSFNSMAAGLENARDQLLRGNTELQASNRRLLMERRLLATVLESVTTGVLAVDAEGRITVCNPAARTLLRLGEEVSLEALRARSDLGPLGALIAEAKTTGTPPAPRELLLASDEGERRLEVAIRPLSAPAGERSGWVLAIEDTTHVAREQKLAAWSEVARRVAHEIKNPLTPIRLSAERIAKRLRSGSPDLPHAIERGTQVILEEVDFLKSLVDEFSRFARLPEMRPEPTDLHELASSAVRLFEGAREGIRIRLASDLTRSRVQLDPEQIKRALINLIDNALEACEASGEITVRLADGPRGVTIEVADTGRGVAPRDRDKLFLPDFTTKGRGTGLGLAIVHKIVSDHNGTIRVEDNRPRGARFIIDLPAA